MNESRVMCMFSLSCDDLVHAILYTDFCMFFTQLGWRGEESGCGSGPRPLPREDGEQYREGGPVMVM